MVILRPPGQVRATPPPIRRHVERVGGIDGESVESHLMNVALVARALLRDPRALADVPDLLGGERDGMSVATSGQSQDDRLSTLYLGSGDRNRVAVTGTDTDHPWDVPWSVLRRVCR